MDRHPPPSSKTWNRRIAILAGICLLALFFVTTTKLDHKGQFKGVFLLKGDRGHLFVLTDDLYLGEGEQLIAGLDLEDIRIAAAGLPGRHGKGDSYLYYGWNEKEGTGYVRSYLPDGRRLQTCFSRFSEGGMHDHGVFIGGGLPSSVSLSDPKRLNETGMSYFDGSNWNHIWCTTNEGIAVGSSFKMVPAYSWKFLGSKAEGVGEKFLKLMSRHEVLADGVPLSIDRSAYFRAGDPYFILVVKVKNIGARAARFLYCYGDEPWVGNYGTASGNVGWVDDGLVDCEQWVDTSRHSYAGFFDCGAPGSGHRYSMAANFIEWIGGRKPSVYFSNGPTEAPGEGGIKRSLDSNEKFIGVEWGPDVLQPRESTQYAMAIGMAYVDPKTGRPVKPEINANYIR